MISCIKSFYGEVKDTCFLVYYGDFQPVIIFKNKNEAIAYCEEHPMIQFKETKLLEMPFNDSSYKF